MRVGMVVDFLVEDFFVVDGCGFFGVWILLFVIF